MEANIISIAKHGLTETTITHVSEAAKMSRGIVNFYFASKENMMLQTLKYLEGEYTAMWQQALETAHAQPPMEQLKALITAHFAAKLCTPKRLTVWAAFWGHASTHANYRKIISGSDERCKKAITACAISAGQMESAAKLFAEELHAMIRGFWLNFLLSADAPNRQKLEATCQAFLQRWFSEPDALRHARPKLEAKQIKKTLKPLQPTLGDLFTPKG